MHPGTAISLVLALAVILYRVLARSKLTHPLPPGPKPLPIVGNINDLPPPGTPEFQHWIKFKDTYGPISSVTVFGVIMIILNCSEAAHQILTKRSKSTSDKMCAPFGDMMCGFGDLTPNINSGPTHTLHRKFMHQQMGTKKIVEDFHDIHDIESKRLLLRTLNQPSRLLEHIKTATGASILKMTYGYSVEPHQADPLVSLIERTMHNFSTALVPLSWAVDIFPSLKYLPSWLPGMSFKKVARQCRQIVLTTKEIPYDFVKERTFQGHSRPSYVSSLLERLGTKGDEWILDHDDNEAIKNTAAIMFGGGADTSASTIKAFILAMILFPGVQRRAQEEIDSVIGTERLPGFEDREDLPYVSALVTESLRWFPVVPVTPTHVVQEDFVYSGYSIPKGAYLISTAWGSLHDPNTYQNPSQFQPERFLQPRNEPDPRDHSFGYGRRICPGRYFADDSLYLIISRMLATFNITKALDKDGKPLDVELRPVAGLISYPEAFPFSVSPRSAQHNKLLRAIEAADLWDESDAGHLRDHGADGNILV